MSPVGRLDTETTKSALLPFAHFVLNVDVENASPVIR